MSDERRAKERWHTHAMSFSRRALTEAQAWVVRGGLYVTMDSCTLPLDVLIKLFITRRVVRATSCTVTVQQKLANAADRGVL